MLAYHIPETVEEALSLRAEYGSDGLVMGGGTIVMPTMNEGLPLPGVVIGLKRAGLDTVDVSNGARVIGAMTTMAKLTGDENSLLAEAASACGGWAVKNLATIGGNLFAPAPAGDVAVALMALDARVRLGSLGGTRVVPIDDFFENGRQVGENEIVTGVEILTAATDTRFIKYGRRSGPTPSVVTVAVSLIRDGAKVTSARIALGAMAPHPVRAGQAESLLVGNDLTADLVDEVAAAVDELEGLTDSVASAWYRKRMARLHVKRLLEELMHE